MKKDRNEELERLVIECMVLAYLVQLRTDYAVFIDYSGHVDDLRIDIRESPTNYTKEVASTNFYTSGRYQNSDKSDPLAWIKDKRDALKSILEDGNFEHESFYKEAITTYETHF